MAALVSPVEIASFLEKAKTLMANPCQQGLTFSHLWGYDLRYAPR